MRMRGFVHVSGWVNYISFVKAVLIIVKYVQIFKVCEYTYHEYLMIRILHKYYKICHNIIVS